VQVRNDQSVAESGLHLCLVLLAIVKQR
jgi:hypothetical protein